MTGYCGNCGTKVDQCDREGCRENLQDGRQIVCLLASAGYTMEYRHFCSVAHASDQVLKQMKKDLYVTTVAGPGGVAVHE